MKTAKCEKVLKGHSLPVWAIIEIEPNKVLATGSSDFTIKIWDLEIARSMQTLIGHSAPIWCMTMLDEMLIASGSEDCFIKVILGKSL